MNPDCPYCGKEVEICHDDGYGYSEGETHQQECHHCGKVFVFTTSISFWYDLEQAPCLNGDPHRFKPTWTYPRRFTRMRCEWCDEERDLLPEEWELVFTKEKPATDDDPMPQIEDAEERS